MGLVSADVPLISNLAVWGNIALIYQYHREVSRRNAEALVLQYLGRYNLEHVAYKRNSELSEEQRFRVMILRAAMLTDAVIVIDRPFKLLHYNDYTSFVYESLETIDDLFARCEIFDYEREKRNCGPNHDSEG